MIITTNKPIGGEKMAERPKSVSKKLAIAVTLVTTKVLKRVPKERGGWGGWWRIHRGFFHPVSDLRQTGNTLLGGFHEEEVDRAKARHQSSGGKVIKRQRRRTCAALHHSHVAYLRR